MSDDAELLRAYVQTGSQEAFATLVRSKLPLVLSAALRRAEGDNATAEDIAQTVFAVLAQKAEALQFHPFLSGWLFKTTYHVATRAVRQRRLRERRETEMSHLAPDELQVPWATLRPVIDDALLHLGEGDRRAILLRFFENQSFAHIGRSLELSEDAARMRVNRGLEALRRTLSRRGISSTASALGLTLSSHATTAVPPALAATILHTALSAPLSHGLLFAMTLSSFKTTLAVAIAVGAITFGLIEHLHVNRARSETTALQAQLARSNAEVASLRAAKAVQPPPPGTSPLAAAAPTPSQPSSSVNDPFDPAFNLEARKLYLAKQAVRITLEEKPFFKKMGLTEAQWDRYLKDITESTEVELDAKALAQTDGLSPKEQEEAIREQILQLKRDLVETLGPEMHQQLIAFNKNLRAQASTQELAGQLTFSEQPLSRDQAQTMATILSQDSLPFGRSPDGGILLSKPAMEQVRGVLSPAQFEILQQQQALHRADMKLAALKTHSPP